LSRVKPLVIHLKCIRILTPFPRELAPWCSRSEVHDDKQGSGRPRNRGNSK
jgi:hypothetical protein